VEATFNGMTEVQTVIVNYVTDFMTNYPTHFQAGGADCSANRSRM
jgi:hypothetical protein